MVLLVSIGYLTGLDFISLVYNILVVAPQKATYNVFFFDILFQYLQLMTEKRKAISNGHYKAFMVSAIGITRAFLIAETVPL